MKKDQIIEAARLLFHKYGFKKVSMDEIAREAGVTKRTIYSYFSSKEDLLKYFIQEEILNMKNIVEEIDNKNLDFFETVSQSICSLLKYRRDRNFLNTITKEAEWLKNPIIINNLELIDTQIQNYIKGKLEKAKESGNIYYEDVDITAFLIYKMYIALMFEWNESEKKLDEQLIASSISAILKNGLRKDVN